MVRRFDKASFFLVVYFLLTAYNLKALADDRSFLLQKVEISKHKGTVYQLFKEISDCTGYLFIYDSQIIDNNKKIRIPKGTYTLQEAILKITDNRNLQIDVIDNHILLRNPTLQNIPEKSTSPASSLKQHFVISGTIHDEATMEPVIYATVSINHSTIGTITNQNGEFQLIIPDSLSKHKIKLSHIGYESKEFEAELLNKQKVDFFLTPKVVPLQEITVGIKDPVQILKKMIESKERNYSQNPVYLTTFYREGIEYKKNNIDITEAVLKIYKSSYEHSSIYDQVKLIKKRRIINHQLNDTLFPKMKSGINSCLVLDIMKELPDFIDPAQNSSYTYNYTDIRTLDKLLVHVISFHQKESVKEPLYTGFLFVEATQHALSEVRFQVNPRLANKATNIYIAKKNKDIDLTLLEAEYIVSYKPDDSGIYHLNHIRGDIVFKVKKKRQLFSSPLHFWFEMVTCKVDTDDVKSFPKNERLSPSKIFAETLHHYDKNFWEHFNQILPEEDLKKAIIQNLNEVFIDENE